MTMRHALGSIRIFKRRTREAGRPALASWATIGEDALADVSRAVIDAMHANECAERSVVDVIRSIRASVKDANARRALESAEAKLSRCAERSHNISQLVKL